MDGLESSRQIRAFENTLKSHDRVPIIALTGVAQAEVQRNAIASGMNLFLTKPVRLDAIARVMEGQTGINLAKLKAGTDSKKLDAKNTKEKQREHGITLLIGRSRKL